MKKALLIAAVAASASMPSLANDNYIALEIGRGQHITSGDSSNTQFGKDLEDMGQFSIKAGHYFDKNVRAYGYLQGAVSDEVTHIVIHPTDGIHSVKTQSTTVELGAGADYLHYINDQFYLLAGGNLGVYKSELEVSVDGLTLTEDNTGLAAGANLGLGYKFTERFGMELGYRYTHYFGNEFKDYGFNIDGNQNAYLNASYSF
ncbi:outer membrane beta-barrel protein [Vibrio sp. OCN044]|uniref:Outer membrane beta-barrel protein n=1 Tax=Vibrio tetraodonis subsp. pristinus TaxID=2695891 RepID=A0A6L8LRQ9_9VIBR|nr:outer membrane beta-barrel protein [Vibrio tetraodonis]MYM57816.1 outer membrane beta-barrel protein [Vibrio tetraodonis subsp. pristinus]